MSPPGVPVWGDFRIIGVILAILFVSLASSWTLDYLDRPIPRDLQQKVPRASPFLDERYRSLPPGDMATARAIAAVLAATGHSDDATLLAAAVQRRALKALLDEPYQPAATIEAAVRQEVAEIENVDALRGRARGQVLFERVPRSDGEPSTTRDKEGRDALHVRFQVSNQLVRPVTPVLRFDDGKFGAFVHVRCTAESGAPVPARGTARALCSSVFGPSRFVNATAYVLRNDAVKPIALRLEFGDVVVTEHFVLPGDLLVDDGERAWREVSAADCQALSACEEVERRKQVRFQELLPQRFAAVLMLFFAGLLWLGLLRMAPGSSEDASALVSVLAWSSLALCVASAPLLYALLHPEMGIMMVLTGSAGIALILLLAQAVAAVVLGTFLIVRSAERTRLRFFALGISIAVPAIALFSLTCRVSTLAVTCR